MNPTDPTTSSILLVRSSILELRGQKALIDSDLARFYGVTTSRLNEQVKRNPNRFPKDFMFQLTAEERREVIANCDHLSRKMLFSNRLPFAFTEHGAIMAASVLNTPQAVQMSVYVVRAFVAMRQAPSGPPDWAAWLREIGARLDDHDDSIRLVAQALEELLSPIDAPAPRPLGFRPDPDAPT
jgi:hypothetical protein